MTQPPLILASGSPRRRQLLVEAGYEIEVVVPSPQAECGLCSRESPAELVARLARSKAADVARQLADRGDARDVLLLAADTVAECDTQIFGKPADERQAAEMLRRLSGRRHHVLTGVCVRRCGQDAVPDDSAPARHFTGRELVDVALTVLEMDRLSEGQLQAYVESGLWQGKAGGFGYQDRLGWVRVVSGSESNVVGLPMELVANMLSRAGYRVPER